MADWVLRGVNCWCKHAKADHRDGECQRCYGAVARWFDPRHDFRPIPTLPPRRLGLKT